MARTDRKKKRPQPRKLFLKFRVKPLVRMPKSVMLDKLRRAVETGIMPNDLVIAYMSYDRSVGQQFRPGERIQGNDHEELQKFYDVLIAMGKPDLHDMEVEPRRTKYSDNPEGGEVRLARPD